MRRALRATVDVALVALVVAALAAGIGSRLIVASGQVPVVVAGRSMEPTIPLGSLAIAGPVPAAALRAGDVTLVQLGPGRSPITHRVTRVIDRDGEPWLELKGDANATPDQALVPATAVVGRVTIVVPMAGRLVAALSGTGGLLALAGLAGLLYALALALEPASGVAARDRSRVATSPPVHGAAGSA